MKSTRLIVLITSLTLVVAGLGARAEESARQARDDINTIAIDSLKRWNTAFNEGDLEQVANQYSPDAVVMTSAGPATDREAISRYWQAVRDTGFNAHGINITGIETNGDQIVVTSNWEAVRSPDEIVFEGDLVSILDRQPDGSWKLSYQSWK